MRVRIKKWDEFQHYKERNPPWVKLHNDMLTGETWAMVSDKDRYIMLVSMMVASRGENHGTIPSEEYMKRVAYLSKAPDFQPLVEIGWFEVLDDASTTLADDSNALANVTPSVSVSDSLFDSHSDCVADWMRSDEFIEAWLLWVKFRKEIKKALPPSTVSRQIKTLAKMGEANAIKSIEQSITQGWTGLFEPRQDKPNKPKRDSSVSSQGTKFVRPYDDQ